MVDNMLPESSQQFVKEPLLGYFDDEKPAAAVKVDPTLVDNRQRYLDKVRSSGLSLLDQPMYPEFTKKSTFCYNPFHKARRPPELAHVADEVWDRYLDQFLQSKGYDFVDFPGVASITPHVPMNLDTNPEAIARANALAHLAIKSYYHNNNTGFEVVSVDKANCNPELSKFVDSEKYIIAYTPARVCPEHSDYSETCFFCLYLLTNDMFLITFTAKDKNKAAIKVFQAQVKHLRAKNEDVVTHCKEKEVVGSLHNTPS